MLPLQGSSPEDLETSYLFKIVVVAVELEVVVALLVVHYANFAPL